MGLTWGLKGNSLEEVGNSYQPKHEGGFGFKNLYKFNETMLAKQVWRLIPNADSMLYKVF